MADLFAVVDGDASAASPLLVVELPGAVRGKGRPRARMVIPRIGRPFVTFYTDADTVAYELALKQRAAIKMKGRPPFKGPLAVRVFAMMTIPRSWPNRERDAALAGTKFPTTKPDGDNVLKVVLDSFNELVWVDDTQVVRSLIVKEYAENPGLIVEVYGLP